MRLPDLPSWLPVAVDTETNGLYADDGARVSIVSIGWIDPAVVTGEYTDLVQAVKTGQGVHSMAFPFSQGIWTGRHGFKDGTKLDLFSGEEDNPNLGEDEWYDLLWWLMQRRFQIYQNGKFDLEKLRYAPIGWKGCDGFDFDHQWYWDTQVANFELWPGESTSLKPSAARLWGIDSTKEAEAIKPHLKSKDNPRFDLVPWEVIGPYAAKDAELTIRLYYQQMARLGLLDPDWSGVQEGLLRQCRKQIAVAKNLYRMERAGIPFDVQGSLDAAAALEDRRRELDADLPFKPTPPQAKAYFFGDGVQTTNLYGRQFKSLGIPAYSHTKTGPQFTEQVVTRIINDFADEEAGRVAKTWAKRNKLKTANTMWYLPYAHGTAPDGRLRTCFRQVTRGRGEQAGGTRSGRFSVERINLQAIPHDYKLRLLDEDWPVLTPRELIAQAAERIEGWRLWEFDLAQAELRLAAAWANCDRMLDAFDAGRDLHGETASELFNVSPGDSDWKFYRQVGKRGNFTLCFGAGGETFVNMVAKETGRLMSIDEGQVLVEKWNRLYPEFRRTIDVWSNFAERNHFVPLASQEGFGTGRHRRFERFEDTHKAFNQLVQGSLGEFAKDWNLETERVCTERGIGGRVDNVGWTGLCLVIHDSQVVLLPASELGAAIAASIEHSTAALWSRFFGAADPAGRVSPVNGFAEGKLWG